jgi:FtsP/CotA-like multicopper oxidase with cupredoxin domain
MRLEQADAFIRAQGLELPTFIHPHPPFVISTQEQLHPISLPADRGDETGDKGAVRPWRPLSGERILTQSLVVNDPRDPRVDLDYTMVLNDGPLGFTLNGKGFPATEPIEAAEGDIVRIRYMNEGLQIHPMHLHGIPQQVVAKDGHWLEHPYMADTVLVAPGERYDVLVDATELGTWAFHCHILSHAEGPDGMFGMVTAMIVQ